MDGAVANLSFLIVNRSRNERRIYRRRTGPSAKLVHAVVEMKQRNPRWGCPRIAQQIALAFNLPFDKDVVRRILGHHYLPEPASGGPAWLTDSPSLMNDFPPLASCCGQADEAPDSSLRTLVNARNAVRCQRRLRLPRRLGPGFEMIQKQK